MKYSILALFLTAVTSSAQAVNKDLAQASPAPLGERVANYLQNMMTIKTAIWEQNHPTDMDYREDIHLAVSYEPSQTLIGVSVIGTQDDPKYAQALLEKIRKTMLSFGKKIKNDYGVDLSEGDFSLAYLNVRTGKIILRFKEGKIVKGDSDKTPGVEATQTPEPKPAYSTEVDMTPKL